MQRFLSPVSERQSLFKLDSTTTVSWSQFAGEVENLKKSGSVVNALAGRTVAVLLPEEPHFALLKFALLSLMRLVPINPALKPFEIARQLSQSRSNCLVTTPELAARYANMRPDLPVVAYHPVSGDAAFGRFELINAAGPIFDDIDVSPGLVLFTSGSSGMPKAVPLRLEQLHGSAREIGETLSLDADDVTLHALPMFHVGGFVDLLLAPVLYGGTVSFVPARTADAIHASVMEQKRCWLQLVPTMLAQMLSVYGQSEWRDLNTRLRFIRCVSSSLSETQQRVIEAHLPDVPIVQMYGMTETAGQITSNGCARSEQRYGSVGRSRGAAVRIAPDTGEVQVQGQGVMSGYIGEADQPFSADGWLCTGDIGRLDADGFLYLEGRQKDMINSGGEKISPFEIETAAMSHPGIAQAVVFPKPHPTLGETPVLVVELANGVNLSAVEIEAHLQTLLADYKRPTRILVEDQLLKLPGGKIDRQAIRASELVETINAGYHASLDGVPALIAQAWLDVLRRPVPGPDADFFDESGDSLSATQLIFEAELSTGRRIVETALFDAPRFEAFCQLVEALPSVHGLSKGKRNRLLRFVSNRVKGWTDAQLPEFPTVTRASPDTNRLPFFWCCQSENEYRWTADTIGRDRAVLVLRTLFQKQGKTDDENRMLAQHYAQAIVKIQPRGAITIGGFCAGANLAILVADWLVSMGREVNALILWDFWSLQRVDHPALLIWSENNAYSGREAASGLREYLPVLYPKGALILERPGNHMESFSLPFSNQEIDLFHDIVDGVKRPVSMAEMPIAADKFDVKARLTVSPVPWVTSAGAPIHTIVNVTNKGSEAILPSNENGVSLFASFLNFDGHHRLRHAGMAKIEQPIMPRAQVKVPMVIISPAKRLPMILRVSLMLVGHKAEVENTVAQTHRFVLVR